MQDCDISIANALAEDIALLHQTIDIFVLNIIPLQWNTTCWKSLRNKTTISTMHTANNLVGDLLLTSRRWRPVHQLPRHRPNSMMTSSNGNIFRVTGHLCGEFTGLRWIPHTKASDAELGCFLWYASEKRLSKQSWGWWFETLSRPLWRHRYVSRNIPILVPEVLTMHISAAITTPIVYWNRCRLTSKPTESLSGPMFYT